MVQSKSVSRHFRAALLLALTLMMALLVSCSQGQPSASSASSSSDGQKAIAFDLGNDADRALVNECLSWLAQEYRFYGPIDAADPDDQVRFAVHYLGLTDRDTWESGDYTAIAGRGGGANGSTNMRVSTGNVDDVSLRFFGAAPDYASMDGALCKRINDYVYFGVTAPPGQSAGYAAATGLEPEGDGSYTALFEVYDNGMPYTPKDASFYGKDPSGMMAELGVSAPLCTGRATLRPIERDGEVSLIVESYSIDGATDAGTPSTAAPIAIATPYYTIEVPADWPAAGSSVTYEVDEGLRYADGAPNLGIGYHATISIDGGTVGVACFTDTWGPQGDFKSVNVGAPENLPGWHVCAYTASASACKSNNLKDLTGLLDEFASFITLASADGADGDAAVNGGAQGGSAAASNTVSRKAEFADRFAAIKDEKASDIRMAGSTQDMKHATSEYNDRYAALMDEVLAYLRSLPSIDEASLDASQEAWLSETEVRVESVVSESGRGSFAGLAGLAERALAYEERLAVLIDMIPE